MKKNNSGKTAMRLLKFLLSAACVVLAALPLVLNYGCKRKGTEPNIVLIVIDTLRADHLPFYGYKNNTAPFLSTLASRSAVFENAISPSSWTLPATTSIFTSLYPFQHGAMTGIVISKSLEIDVNRIPRSILTIPELLKDKGYKTYCVANNPNICEETNFSQGFDRFGNFPDDREKEMTAQLENWAGEIQKQNKYFLYIHYNDCHHPYSRNKPWYKRKEKPHDDIIARYDSEISYVDEKIRRLYERFGWDKNTLIIVTADHGEEFWDHNDMGHGQTLYAEVIRVPLLLHFPGKDATSKRIKTNVSTLDILPTIRNYLGIQRRQGREGIDLLPAIRGEQKNLPERYIFSHLMRISDDGKRSHHKATMFQDWKYIYVDKFQKEYQQELYDLRTDPNEQHNVHKQNLPLANLLFAKFLEFERACKKFSQETKKMDLDKKKMEELKTLGYVQ
jgi:choline-sulfatase